MAAVKVFLTELIWEVR